jgi:hypothetical protein
MKRAILASFLVSLGVFAACASEPEAPIVPGTAGTGGSVGGSPGVGGSTTAGTGGKTGGAAGTGTGGTGGSATAGAGGSLPQAGTSGQGTGGATAGTAGVAGTGGTGGMGGMGGMSGNAGTAGTGNMGGLGNTGGQDAGGMSGTTGAAAGMSGAGGGGSGVPTIPELVGALDGHLIITPCGDTPNTDDCAGGGWRSSAVNGGANNVCQNGRLEANITIPVEGMAGTAYDVTMHFYGIMEPRQYSNVTREAPGDPNLNGGSPTPWADAEGEPNITGSGDQNYNTYEIHVYEGRGQAAQAVHSYFINADNGTGHYTMLIDYEKTIQLIGGGEVRLRVADQNCRMIKNCGASGGTPCANKARSVDITAADPQPGTAPPLQQPGLGQQPEHSGQWWLIDVTEVALAN